jgi:hypothetical protein
VQSNEVFAVLAIGLSLISIAGFAVVGVMLRGYRRNQRVIMGSRGTVDVAEHMAIVDDKLTNLRLAVEDLTLTARDHGVRIDGTLSHVGIVRFDAYRDLGGRQSTSVAFMSSHNDGVVITTVVSREFARMYVKLVRDGVGDIPLAPEENEAVQQARRATPFVVKPLLETGVVAAMGDSDLGMLAEGEPMVVSLPGPYEREDEAAREAERENRRRRREGMELIEHADLAPSTQGWAEPETPVPPGVSMAEQFVQQRKRGKKSKQPVKDATSETYLEEDQEEWTAATEVRPNDQWPSSRNDDGWGFDEPIDDDTREH